MFPRRLDAPQAYDIAKAMVNGFNRHYRPFGPESARAKHRFETADCHAQQRAQRGRIGFYDLRERECVRRLKKELGAGLSMDVWQQGQTAPHRSAGQPPSPRTRRNVLQIGDDQDPVPHALSQRCHLCAAGRRHGIHRRARRAPTYRTHCPSRDNLPEAMAAIIGNGRLQREFGDLACDGGLVQAAQRARSDPATLRTNFQIQVLTNRFCRNKGADRVSKAIKGFTELSFVLPLLHGDAILHLGIERRMVSLSISLQEAFDTGFFDLRAQRQMARSVIEDGNAIKDLVAANIFPGQMLWKHFGVTCKGKVVFHGYDEIEYLTDCRFRRVPRPRNQEEELSREVSGTAGPARCIP